MIDIVHRVTGDVLYHSETAQTIAEAVKDAVAARADLAGANLARANLADADLAGANLEDANLEDANLAGANLARANLADADLAGANLEDADLAGANLEDANLEDANLAGANLARANLARANLAGVKGYANSHGIFAEVVRRQPIDTFTPAEWAAIGQIVIHHPCWGTIRERHADVALHVLAVLAAAGFTEWQEHWKEITTKEEGQEGHDEIRP